MRSRRAALVLACAALSGGVLGACGGSDTIVDSVPKSTPDLTVPSNGADDLDDVHHRDDHHHDADHGRGRARVPDDADHAFVADRRDPVGRHADADADDDEQQRRHARRRVQRLLPAEPGRLRAVAAGGRV
jgi:hypothetical protein